jgi:hypothetical protein
MFLDDVVEHYHGAIDVDGARLIARACGIDRGRPARSTTAPVAQKNDPARNTWVVSVTRYARRITLPVCL